MSQPSYPKGAAAKAQMSLGPGKGLKFARGHPVYSRMIQKVRE
jgi:hypothetical protein